MWGNDHEITAVEFEPKIAEIYKDYFPNDTVLVADAHQYLLDHFNDFDFIWASPPCPTHSAARNALAGASYLPNGKIQHEIVYPDMKLWQEIILLQTHCKSLYCIENVKPYYEPMFNPQIRERHCFWANFYIHDFTKTISKHDMNVNDGLEMLGYNLDKYTGIDKRKIMRNCVLPEVGLHILESATKNIQDRLF